MEAYGRWITHALAGGNVVLGSQWFAGTARSPQYGPGRTREAIDEWSQRRVEDRDADHALKLGL